MISLSLRHRKSLSEDETKLEGLYNSLHDLGEYTDPKFYKSYDELKTKMNSVLGLADTMPIRDEVKMTPMAEPTQMSEMPPQSVEEEASAPCLHPKRRSKKTRCLTLLSWQMLTN